MTKYGYNSDDMIRAFFVGLFIGVGIMLALLFLGVL